MPSISEPSSSYQACTAFLNITTRDTDGGKSKEKGERTEGQGATSTTLPCSCYLPYTLNPKTWASSALFMPFATMTSLMRLRSAFASKVAPRLVRLAFAGDRGLT